LEVGKEALDLTVWRTSFGRGYGPVKRQTAELLRTACCHTMKRGAALLVGRTRVRFPLASLELFIDIILPARTVALGSTQPLAEKSTRDISWDKGGRCIGLTTLPPSGAECLQIWELQPPGILWACPGL